MKFLTRKRIISLFLGGITWVALLLLEDPVKRMAQSIVFPHLNLSPFFLASFLMLLLSLALLIFYWHYSDKAKRKKAARNYLIDQLQMAQIACRYNHEVVKDINRILQDKLGKEAMLHGLLFPDVMMQLQSFRFDSLDLLSEQKIEELKNAL